MQVRTKLNYPLDVDTIWSRDTSRGPGNLVMNQIDHLNKCFSHVINAKWRLRNDS